MKTNEPRDTSGPNFRTFIYLPVWLVLFFIYGFSQSQIHKVAFEYSRSLDGIPLITGLNGKSVQARDGVPQTTLATDNVLALRGEYTLPEGTYTDISISQAVLLSDITITDYGGNILEVLSNMHPAADQPLPLSPPIHSFSFPLFVQWSLNNIGILVALLFGTFILHQFLLPRIRSTTNLKYALIVSVALLPIIPALLGYIRYDTEDDPEMELLCNGAVSGTPSENLVFVGLIPGLILKALYTGFPRIPWYPIFLAVTTQGSLVALYLMSLKSGRCSFLWASIVYLVFAPILLLNLEFTVSAYLVCLVGFVLVFYSKTPSIVPVGVMCLLLGTQIRFDAVELVIATMMPYTLLFAPSTVLRKLIAIVLIFFGACALTKVTNLIVDLDPGWKEYRVVLSYLGQPYCMPYYQLTQAGLDRLQPIGWGKEEYEMMETLWLFQDPVTFSPQNIKAFLKILIETCRPYPNEMVFWMFQEMGARLPAIELLSILAIFIGVTQGNKYLLKLILIAGPTIFLFYYFSEFYHLPGRLFVPMAYGFFYFFFVFCFNRPLDRVYKRRPIVLTISAAVILSASLMVVCNEDERHLNQSLTDAPSIATLSELHDAILVNMLDAVMISHLDPFSDYVRRSNIHMINLVWAYPSPSFLMQLHTFGIERLFPAIGSHRVLLIWPTWALSRRWAFEGYLDRVYHQHIKLVPVVLKSGAPAMFPTFTVMEAVPLTNQNEP